MSLAMSAIEQEGSSLLAHASLTGGWRLKRPYLQCSVSLLALSLLLRSALLGALHALLRLAGRALVRQPAAPQLHGLCSPGLFHFCLQMSQASANHHCGTLWGPHLCFQTAGFASWI